MSFYDKMETLVGKQIDERIAGTNNFHFKAVKIDFDKIFDFKGERIEERMDANAEGIKP